MSITVQFVCSLSDNLNSPSRLEPLHFLPPETSAVVGDFLRNADKILVRISASGRDTFPNTETRQQFVESVTRLVQAADEWRLRTRKPLSHYSDEDYAMRELAKSLQSASRSASEYNPGFSLEPYRSPGMSEALTASKGFGPMPIAD